jgi:hypothetical protein
MSESANSASETTIDFDILVGFLAPQPFNSTTLSTIDENYGVRYHAARVELSDVLLLYSSKYRGLKNMKAETEAYDSMIEKVHEAAVDFAAEVREMIPRVTAARASTPAVEFVWRFIEPAILIHDQSNEKAALDEDLCTHGDPQQQYAPPSVRAFASPSTVFELCAALTLLAATHLRLLERRRRYNSFHDTSADALISTLAELQRATRCYSVVPLVESRSYLHPLLVSQHFVENGLAPLIYAQTLAMTTDTYVEGTSTTSCCLKAAVLNMSAELLEDLVCVNMPPLLCSQLQRRIISNLASDRQAIAYFNMARVSLLKSAKLVAGAAIDREIASNRVAFLDTTRFLLGMAYFLSD